MTLRGRIWMSLVATLFADPARPIEWLSGLALAGWASYLLQNPDVLLRDNYTAFQSLPATAWAIIMAIPVLVQLIAMLPIVRGRGNLRFVAMALATSCWTVIAINFWAGAVVTPGSRTYTAMAFMTAATGLYLGWNSKRR